VRRQIGARRVFPPLERAEGARDRERDTKGFLRCVYASVVVVVLVTGQRPAM
jgi:uncharacterized protein Veg